MTPPTPPTTVTAPDLSIGDQLKHLLSPTTLFGSLGAIAANGPKIAANPKDLQAWMEMIAEIGAVWRLRVAVAKSGVATQ